MSTNGSKQHAHELIDQLTPNQVAAVVGLIEAMLDPVSRAVAQAPMDDEALSAGAERALDEARDWSKQNTPIQHERVIAELGLTPEEIESYKDSMRSASAGPILPDRTFADWTGRPRCESCLPFIDSRNPVQEM